MQSTIKDTIAGCRRKAGMTQGIAMPGEIGASRGGGTRLIPDEFTRMAAACKAAQIMHGKKGQK
jgi:hypothetical protein